MNLICFMRAGITHTQRDAMHRTCTNSHADRIPPQISFKANRIPMRIAFPDKWHPPRIRIPRGRHAETRCIASVREIRDLMII